MTQPADPAAPKNEVPKPGTVSYLDQITKAAAVFGAISRPDRRDVLDQRLLDVEAELHKKEKELKLSQSKRAAISPKATSSSSSRKKRRMPIR